MVRLAHRTYDRRIMIAMTIYIIVLVCVWPLAKAASEPLPKIGYALTPVLPLFYVIWIMAQKILRSDELEQRTHLIGLGVAAAVVSILSIVSAFIAAAGAMTIESTSVVLMWIFPLMMLSYGAARSYAARHYGVSACDEGERLPQYIRFIWAAALFAAAAAYLYLRGHRGDAADFLFGMSFALAVGGSYLAWRRWRQRRANVE